MQEENKYITFLKQIWPTVYRVINTIFYAIFNFLKQNIKFAIDQLSGKL